MSSTTPATIDYSDLRAHLRPHIWAKAQQHLAHYDAWTPEQRQHSLAQALAELLSLRQQHQEQAEAEAEAVTETLPQDIWVFAYGSLIWRPEFDYSQRLEATLPGYRRALCLWSAVNRGSPERLGLVFGLAQGGQCQGVLYKLTNHNLAATLDALWQRELPDDSYTPRWLDCETSEGPITALVFLPRADHSAYVDDLTLEETVAVAMGAHGIYGPCTEYVIETAEALAQAQIDDDEIQAIAAAIREAQASENAQFSMGGNLASMRTQYQQFELLESEAGNDPFALFQRWFDEAVASSGFEANAMTLATVNDQQQPEARVVLLKGFSEQGFVFFANYHSAKGQAIAHNPQVSLSFYWPQLERQVRIVGKANKLSESDSTAYFNSRPRDSRIGAWVSPQSQPISRDALAQRFTQLKAQFADAEVPKPPHWGGYMVAPQRIEFWQGRPSRLHDRLLFVLENQHWHMQRLAP